MTAARLLWPALACGYLLAAAAAIRAQSVTEWSVETRIALSIKAADAGVRALLPAGWTSEPSTAAANRGANLTVTFMERLLVLDGQGKTRRTGTIRYMVMSAPVRNAATGQTATMIVGGISPDGAGAYDVYRTATEARVARSGSGQMEDAGVAQEDWVLATATGERVDLHARYRRATPVKAAVTSVLRSAAHPEFTRTYRIEQATDVLRSLTTADRLDELRFSAAGPGFKALFDGSEQILSVTSIPYYTREISVP